MIKGEYIYLRLFEPEDYQKTYLWHNDVELQKSTCGPIRIVSKEIEKNWVLSKSANNKSELYLAICLNETDEMIGWYSITEIDYLNRKCNSSGIVIGDKRYRDGFEYQEAAALAFSYIMNELNMNRVSGACLKEHILSRALMEANFWTLEGIERQSIFKNGSYHDICRYSILREEYLQHFLNGDYDPRKRIQRVGKLIQKLRKEINPKNQE